MSSTDETPEQLATVAARFEVEQFIFETAGPIVGTRFTDYEKHAMFHRFKKLFIEMQRLRAENAALRERGEKMVPDEWRVRYYQLRGCISTDPMMDGTNKIRGVNIPILNNILEQHRNNPVEGANDADR